MHLSLFLSTLTITSLALPTFSLPHPTPPTPAPLQKRITVDSGFCQPGTCPSDSSHSMQRRDYNRYPVELPPTGSPSVIMQCTACSQGMYTEKKSPHTFPSRTAGILKNKSNPSRTRSRPPKTSSRKSQNLPATPINPRCSHQSPFKSPNGYIRYGYRFLFLSQKKTPLSFPICALANRQRCALGYRDDIIDDDVVDDGN